MKLADCTRLQKQWLKRRVCRLCERPLNKDGCGGIYEKCTPEIIEGRRASALKLYMPRVTPSHPKEP